MARRRSLPPGPGEYTPPSVHHMLRSCCVCIGYSFLWDPSGARVCNLNRRSSSANRAQGVEERRRPRSSPPHIPSPSTPIGQAPGRGGRIAMPGAVAQKYFTRDVPSCRLRIPSSKRRMVNEDAASDGRAGAKLRASSRARKRAKLGFGLAGGGMIMQTRDLHGILR